MDTIIATKDVQVERKNFSIQFRENERGRFLRIIEESQGHRNTVIVPSTGLDDFFAAMQFVLEEAAKPSPAA